MWVQVSIKYVKSSGYFTSLYKAYDKITVWDVFYYLTES